MEIEEGVSGIQQRTRKQPSRTMAGYTSKCTLGDVTTPLHTGQSKKAAMQRPTSDEKYNNYLQAHLQEKQICNRVNTLVTKITGTMLAKQEHDFEHDKEITKGKIKAERQCRKVKAGKYRWMLELNKVIQMVLYWKGIKKRKKEGKLEKTY